MANDKQAPMAQPTGGDAKDSDDPLIAKVQDALRAKLPAQYRVAVQKIVMAGMTIMFSPQTHHLMLKGLETDTDPAHAVAMGVTQLITILFRESKGTMPIPAVAPAAILLCCEALDFMEKSGMVKVTPDIMDSVTQDVIAYLMQKVGLTPEKMSQIAQNAAHGHPDAQPPSAPVPAPAPAAPQSGGLVGQQMGAPQ